MQRAFPKGLHWSLWATVPFPVGKRGFLRPLSASYLPVACASLVALIFSGHVSLYLWLIHSNNLRFAVLGSFIH